MAATIDYCTGDATRPGASGPKIIVHVCNDVGGWGKGFVVAISKRWPQPEDAYRAWYKDRANNDFRLGAVQLVEVEPQLWVANLIGQQGLRASGGIPPIRYDAIREGLTKVAEIALARGATLHMPRIGCGLAGGSWEEIEAILQHSLCAHDIPVTVYDLA